MLIYVAKLTQKLIGLLFDDKEKKLFQELFNEGLKFVAKIKKDILISLKEKTLLRKSSIIKMVFYCLKSKFEIEHTRHRFQVNFLIHIFSMLASYLMQSKKPNYLLHKVIRKVSILKLCEELKQMQNKKGGNLPKYSMHGFFIILVLLFIPVCA